MNDLESIEHQIQTAHLESVCGYIDQLLNDPGYCDDISRMRASAICRIANLSTEELEIGWEMLETYGCDIILNEVMPSYEAAVRIVYQEILLEELERELIERSTPIEE